MVLPSSTSSDTQPAHTAVRASSQPAVSLWTENLLYYWLPNVFFSVGSAKSGARLHHERPESCVRGWMYAEARHAEAALPLNARKWLHKILSHFKCTLLAVSV